MQKYKMSSQERFFDVSRFRVIVFDLDGTLVEIIPRHAINTFLNFSKRVFDDFNLKYDKEKLIHSYQQALCEWTKIKKDLHGRRKYLELWALCFKNAGLPSSNLTTLASILQKEIEENSEDKLYSDVISLLSKLHDKGFEFGILSERPESAIKASLLRHNISHYFGFCISAYDLDNTQTKLNSKIWETLIKIAKHGREEICYIGDDYEVDIAPAMSHGIPAILLDRKGKNNNLKCIKIKSLHQLAKLMNL
jgi:FMN phosphatase YigB (HAD superfamily)